MKAVSTIILCLVAAAGVSAAPQPAVTAAPVARNLVERQDLSSLLAQASAGGLDASDLSSLASFNPFTDSELASILSGQSGAVNSALAENSAALASAIGTKSADGIISRASSLLNGGATVSPSSGGSNGAMGFNVPAFGAAAAALGAGAALVIAAL